MIPTLVLEDGTAIGEVPSIWRYLDETYPPNQRLGATPKEKALVGMWERRMELEGLAAAIEGVRNALPGLTGRAIGGPREWKNLV
jgi:glutathione S-transferase